MARSRSYYCQLRSSYNAWKTKSGSGTSDIKKPNWIYFDMLKLLDNNLMPKGPRGMLSQVMFLDLKKRKTQVPLKKFNG